METKQIDIFECLFETYKIKKQIRLIEFFAGYGSQALALKYLGVNFEHWKICEWAIKSIIAYADLHRDELKDYGKDFSKDLTKERVAKELFNYGVSDDYNTPATFEQLMRMSEDKLKLCYNSILWTNNLVDISRVKGTDLQIEREREYILTYSFPCQDLSLAGNGAGIEKGSGTRSSLLWEVERILGECENKPQILLMENVIQIHSQKNNELFKKFQLRLEEMGYQNYWQDLSAVDFGIPQTRNRTFMVSILGNYNYNFPKRIPLELRLKDLLQPSVQVAEKYYLSDKMIKYISANNDKWTGNNGEALINKEIASTINTAEGNRRCDASNFVSDELPENYDLKYGLTKHLQETFSKNHIKDCKEYDVVDAYNKSIIKDGTYPTVTAKVPASDDKYVFIKEEDINYSEESLRRIKKNIVQGDIANTLTANAMQSINHQNCASVMKEEKTNEEIKPRVIAGVGEMKSNGGTQFYQQDRVYDDSVSISLATGFNPNYKIGLRIRKLTPVECFRLMGLKDEDIDKVMEHQTNASAYHLAGDSIVTTCLMSILGELVGVDWQEKFNAKDWWKNE